MRWREFIAALGSAAAWPLVARAQQADKLPTIGFLGSDASLFGPRTAAFVERLRQLGWTDGRTIAIEYGWSEARPERFAEIAADLVRRTVDVIVANGDAIAPLKQATAVIPIVFVLSNDPLGVGLVASLARPGGNVTGLSNQSTDLAGKRLELLHEVVPRLRRLAVLGNVGYPGAVLEMREVQATAHSFPEVAPLEIGRPEDIAPAIESLKAQADALLPATAFAS
jgi:putative ABC transport system substrate-binding protein